MADSSHRPLCMLVLKSCKLWCTEQAARKLQAPLQSLQLCTSTIRGSAREAHGTVILTEFIWVLAASFAGAGVCRKVFQMFPQLALINSMFVAFRCFGEEGCGLASTSMFEWKRRHAVTVPRHDGARVPICKISDCLGAERPACSSQQQLVHKSEGHSGMPVVAGPCTPRLPLEGLSAGRSSIPDMQQTFPSFHPTLSAQ